MLFFPLTLTVQRRRGVSSGYDIDGKWVEGTLPDLFTIKGSWQPVSGNELQNFEEGRRERGLFKGYTPTILYTTEQEDPENGVCDIIIKDSKQYEIIKVDPYQNGLINHYRFYASLMLEPNNVN